MIKEAIGLEKQTGNIFKKMGLETSRTWKPLLRTCSFPSDDLRLIVKSMFSRQWLSSMTIFITFIVILIRIIDMEIHRTSEDTSHSAGEMLGSLTRTAGSPLVTDR